MALVLALGSYRILYLHKTKILILSYYNYCQYNCTVLLATTKENSSKKYYSVYGTWYNQCFLRTHGLYYFLASVARF